jgi:hypothetical protein
MWHPPWQLTWEHAWQIAWQVAWKISKQLGTILGTRRLLPTNTRHPSILQATNTLDVRNFDIR